MTVKNLPANFMRNLSQSVERLDTVEISRLIEEIKMLEPKLAEQLGIWLDDFAFEEIKAWCESGEAYESQP